jgi:hypothetical protein
MSISNTVNSRFKKDLKLQIQLHKAFFSDDWILDSLHKSFLNQTTLDLRKEKWTFLNREFTVLISIMSISYKFTKFEVNEIKRMEHLSTKQTKGTSDPIFLGHKYL